MTPRPRLEFLRPDTERHQVHVPPSVAEHVVLHQVPVLRTWIAAVTGPARPIDETDFCPGGVI